MKKLIFPSICLFLAVTCQARIITVDDDGPADFNTIQAAIDAAVDGDVVVVAPGTYTGDGNRDIGFKGKAITVRSEGGPGTCIIDCQRSRDEFHRGFYFHSEEDASSVLDGFTVTGGCAREGGGIACLDSSPSIGNCVMVGNLANRAGGVLASGSDVVLSNCIIVGNRTYQHLGYGPGEGAAVACSHGHPVFRNCVMYGNWAQGYVGGIICGSRGILFLQNCIITGNTARYVDRRQVSATGCTTRPGCMGVYIVNCCIEDDPNAILVEAWDKLPEPPAVYITGDPDFAEPGYWDLNGTPDIRSDDFWVDGDYHLKSQAGRWDPNTQSWVQDDVTSPCIDAGDPSTPIGDEPFPNGGTVNIGAYGGTAEASKSYFGKPLCETIIAGDINGDCKVDYVDLALMSAHWLEGIE